MELQIPNEELIKCSHSTNLILPGWSKTGRRTRAASSFPPPPPTDQHQRPLTTTDDDLSCAELATENLPPKKRKLDETKQHRCNICSKSFTSYQALGGHKAHHRGKERKDEDGGVVTTDDEPPKGGGGATAVHQCTFCYKVFSKGQALGGHRRHCQHPMGENKAKIFTFDLNEIPPHEHDDICRF